MSIWYRGRPAPLSNEIGDPMPSEEEMKNMKVTTLGTLMDETPEQKYAQFCEDFVTREQYEKLQTELAFLDVNLHVATEALEQINKEELRSQRPGGGYSTAARISYQALQRIKER